MNSIQRIRGIRKAVMKFILRKPVQNFVVSGDRACRRLMQDACSPGQQSPSDKAILAWARYDLAREIISGFWEISAV